MMFDGRDPKIMPFMYVLAEANIEAQPLVAEKSAECAAMLESWLAIPASMRKDVESLALTRDMHATVIYWRWLERVLVERPAAVWPIEVCKSGCLWLVVAEA